MRATNRLHDELRPISMIRHYSQHAEGSVLITCGHTKVLCTASVITGVPRFLRDLGQGWITAEYSMLPRATHQRVEREVVRGRQGGRTLEIQRLIGRSLRTAVDLTQLGDNTIVIDCDVIQADGGTRTAAITGGCVALVDALCSMKTKNKIKTIPLRFLVAAASVGIYRGVPILDLDYREDSAAETDMTVVMTADGNFIEMQGTAEKQPFNGEELQKMLYLAERGVKRLIDEQRAVLASGS